MTTPRIYKAEAIVLRQRNIGEADCVLTLLSRQFGKLDAKAKGTRRSTSRLSGHLQPLTRCSLQLARGKTIETVTGAQLLESFPVLRNDLARLSRALYAAELVDKLTTDRAEGEVAYELFLATLRRLSESNQLDSVLRYLELHLLSQAGYSPQLLSCLVCHDSLRPVTNQFSPAAGGVICSQCGNNPTCQPLTVDALKVLRLAQKASWKEMARLRLSYTVSREVETHLRSYIVFVLERDVRAASFLERLRREGIDGPGPLPV